MFLMSLVSKFTPLIRNMSCTVSPATATIMGTASSPLPIFRVMSAWIKWQSGELELHLFVPSKKKVLVARYFSFRSTDTNLMATLSGFGLGKI
jgi:hypothetical protein